MVVVSVEAGDGATAAEVERTLQDWARKSSYVPSSKTGYASKVKVFSSFLLDEGPSFGEREGEEPPSYKRFADHVESTFISQRETGVVLLSCKALWETRPEDRRRSKGGRDDPFASVLVSNHRYFVPDDEEEKEVDQSQRARYAKYVPGKWSEQLATALGLREGEPPAFIRRMLTMGYPPGHLKVPDEKKNEGRGGKGQLESLNIVDGKEEMIASEGGGEKKVAQYKRSDAVQAYSIPGVNGPLPAGADERMWRIQQVETRSERYEPPHYRSYSQPAPHHSHHHQSYDGGSGYGGERGGDSRHYRFDDNDYHRQPTSSSYYNSGGRGGGWGYTHSGGGSSSDDRWGHDGYYQVNNESSSRHHTDAYSDHRGGGGGGGGGGGSILQRVVSVAAEARQARGEGGSASAHQQYREYDDRRGGDGGRWEDRRQYDSSYSDYRYHDDRYREDKRRRYY